MSTVPKRLASRAKVMLIPENVAESKVTCDELVTARLNFRFGTTKVSQSSSSGVSSPARGTRGSVQRSGGGMTGNGTNSGRSRSVLVQDRDRASRPSQTTAQ